MQLIQHQLLGRASVLALVTAALLGAAGGANAQPGPGGDQARRAPSATQLEEVVVTARRVEENIQDVPVAVTALSGDKLEQLVVNNVQDLNKLAPGLQNAGCSGTRESCAPVIRGQGSAFATGRPSVVSYFAEAPNFQTSYYDLANLQVVKGPQGTLFGETATGGVLLYTPRKPTNQFGGYATVQAGDYGYKSFEGAVGGPIMGDKLLFRAALEYRNRDGFTTAVPSYGGPSVDMDNVDRLQWRLSLVWRPLDNLENYLLYAGSRDKINGNSSPILYADPRYMNAAVRNLVPASIPSMAAQWEFATGAPPPPGMTWGQLILAAQANQVQAGPHTTFNNYDRHRESKFQGFVNTTRWDITDTLTLKNIYSLGWTESSGPTIDVDGTNLPVVDTRAIWVPGTTSITQGAYATTGGYPSRAWTDEVQLIGKSFDSRLDWQTGFYYRDDTSRDWTPPQGIISVFGGPQGDPASPTPPPAPPPPASGPPPPAPLAFCPSVGVQNPCTQLSRSKSISYAGFAQGTFAITPDIHLTGGVRRTWDYRRSDSTATTPYSVNFHGVNIAVPVSGRQPTVGATMVATVVPKAHQDTYTITGDWKINPDLLVYAAHRTGYKGGGINANATPGTPERVFGPETLKDVELGAKLDWRIAGMVGRTNVALYRDWYKDIQRSQIIPGTATTATTNLADATIQGFEMDASVDVTEWLRIAGNFAYTDAYYTRWSETRLCSSQVWRPQCVGLPGTTPVVVNHADGVITIAGTTINYEPDALNDVSKYKWSIQPTILLRPWTDEDISFGANIYYLSSWTGNSSNRAETAGVPPLVQDTNLGQISEPFFRKGTTVVDLRFDWRHVKGSPWSVAASVTNVTDELVNVSNAGGFTIGGTAPAIYQEPRLWYLQLNYEFGG